MKSTHVDAKGRARMVDVGGKEITDRLAVASGRVRIKPGVIRTIAAGKIPKGDVLAVARVAGILAAKGAPNLIPLCHGLPVEAVTVDIEPRARWVDIRATVRTHAKTGVEMEALTAVAVAALTLYDMCKALDRGMVIEWIRLERKCGGKSGDFQRGKKG